MIYLFRTRSLHRLICPFILLYIVLFSSCNSDDEPIAPKPKGYFRIELPPKSYVKYIGNCPFTFDYPTYASILADKRPGAEPCWFDMTFPTFKGTINLTYKHIDNNLGKLLEDSRTLAIKHEIKASAIDEQIIMKGTLKVYGLIYNIQGNTASSLQFYLTDSTQHFIRGALYFNVPPNSDSIAPVLDFIRKDVYRMIESFKWKDDE